VNGNRKRGQANRTEAAKAKAQPKATGRLQPLRLFSTPHLLYLGGQGVHRKVESEGSCGEVPGRSQWGHSMTNRSANGGQGRACLMEAKAFSFTHLHQGVCGQHGTEEQRVTSGELAEFPGGTGISGPISVKRNGERRSVSSRTAAYDL
jgi:hypothetical protein